MDWTTRRQYKQAPPGENRNLRFTTERLKLEQTARHVCTAPLNSTPRRQQSRCRSLENVLDFTDDSLIDSDSITGAFCDDEADEFDPVVRSRGARVNGTGNYGDDMAYTRSLPRVKNRDKYRDCCATPRLVRRNHDNSRKSVMFSDDSSDMSSSMCDDIDDAQTLQKTRQLQSAAPPTAPSGRRYIKKQNAANFSGTSSSGTKSGYSHLGSQSPSIARMARSQSPSILKSGRSPSPSILKPGRSPSPSILKTGRSPSPSILKTARSQSPATTRSNRASARSTAATRSSYSSMFRGQQTGTRPSRAVTGDPQSRTQLRDKSGDRSLNSGTYRSREKSQERFVDRARAREKSGDRMLDSSGDRSRDRMLGSSTVRAREKSGDRMLDSSREKSRDRMLGSSTVRAREKSRDRMLDSSREKSRDRMLDSSREKSRDRMLDSSRAREKSEERMLYDRNKLFESGRNRERMKSGSDVLESGRVREREKSWDRLLDSTRTRGRDKSGDRLSTFSSRAKAREKCGERMVGGNRTKSRERLEKANGGRTKSESSSDRWLDDESSWDTTGSYGQIPNCDSPLSPISHAVLPQPFSSKVRTVAKVTPPSSASNNSPRSRQSNDQTLSDKEEDYGIDQEDASELLNVNETKSYSYCEVVLHDDDAKGNSKMGRSGRRQWATSGAAISSLKYKMNSMSTPSLYTSMDEQDSAPDNLSPSTHARQSPRDYKSLQNHKSPQSHDYESPTHDYRSKSHDYGSCDTLSSPQDYRSPSRNSQPIRDATSTTFRRTPLTRSFRRQQWQHKHAAAEEAGKKSCPSSLEKLGQSLCKSLSPSAIFNSLDHNLDENKNKGSMPMRTTTVLTKLGQGKSSVSTVSAKANLRNAGNARQSNTGEAHTKTAVVTPSKTSDNVRKVNRVTSQPQSDHSWEAPGDVASDTASSSEDQIAKALPVDPAAPSITIPDIMTEGALLGKSRDKGFAENWILCEEGHPVKDGGRSQSKVPGKPTAGVNRAANNPLIDSDRPFSPFTPNQKRFVQGQSACDDNNNAAIAEKTKDVPVSPLGIVLFGSKTLFGSKAMNHGIPQPCNISSGEEEEEEAEAEQHQVAPYVNDHNEATSNYHGRHTAPPSETSLQQQHNHVSGVSQRQPRRQTIGALSAEGDDNTAGNKLLNFHDQHAAPPSGQTVQQQRSRVSASGVSQRQPRRQTIGAFSAEGDDNSARNKLSNYCAAPPSEQSVQKQHSHVSASGVSQRQPRQTIGALSAEGDDNTASNKLLPRTRLYGGATVTSRRETHRNTRTQQHGEADSSSPHEPRLHTRRETLAKSCEQLDSSDSSPTSTGRYSTPRSRGILKHSYAKQKTYATHNGSGPSWLDAHNKGHFRGSLAKSCEQLDASHDSWDRNGNPDESNFARSRSFRELQQRSRGNSKTNLNDVTGGDRPSAQSYVNSLPRRKSSTLTPGGTLTSSRFRRLTEGGDNYSLSQENIANDAVYMERNLSDKENKVTTNGQGQGEPEFLMYL